MATVARAAIQIENADLTFELVNRAEYDRNAMQCASVIDQVTGLVIVRAIDDQIVTFDFFPNVRSLELFFFGDKVNVSVDVLDLVFGGCDFGALEVACAMNDLALQVFKRDFVKVDDLDGADACCSEVLDYRRTESACAYDDHFCGLDALLSLDADIAEHQVLAKAFNFRIVKRNGLASFVRNQAFDGGIGRCAASNGGQKQNFGIFWKGGIPNGFDGQFLVVDVDLDEVPNLFVFIVKNLFAFRVVLIK